MFLASLLQLLLRPTVLVRRSRCVVLCVGFKEKRRKFDRESVMDFIENLDVVRTSF
jgi:hypothetical protein